MTIRLFVRSFFLILTVLGLAGTTLHAKGDADTQRAEIREMRDKVLTDLYKIKPELKSRISKAKGYAVFTNVGVNIVFASFAGGHGIVVKNGLIKDSETFMKMGSAGIGLGLGVKDFRAVFVFITKDALDAFVDKGWDFSGQADAAAKSDRKGDAISGSGSAMPGTEIYQITKNGLALQATLQGTKYWKDKELN